MTVQSVEAVQSLIQKSDLGFTLLQYPLIEQDVWSLKALGYTEQDLHLQSLRNLHFEKLGLLWLRHLAKVTVLQRVNERHSISVLSETVYVFKRLDKYLRESGYWQLEDLDNTVLTQFRIQHSKEVQISIQKTLAYAIRLWAEEGWLSVHFVPQKFQHSTPKIKTIPEEVLHQLYNHLHYFPPMLERFIRLQLALGWRLSEVLQLPRGCLKQDDNWYLKHWVGKRKKWEFIGIHPSVAEIIRAQQRFLDNQFGHSSDFGYLFCWLSTSSAHMSQETSGLSRFKVTPVYDSKRLSPACIQVWLRDFSKVAQLKDRHGKAFHLTSHLFRRTKATIMAYCNTEDEYIAAVLGHASLSMLPYYRKFSLERLEREAQQKCYVDFHGTVTSYKPKKTRYERLHDIIMVHTPLGECHRPLMLGDCELRYACLNCIHHRVTLKDRLLLEQDQENLLKDLEKAKAQGHTRRITEISKLLVLINNRLQGLQQAKARLQEGINDEF